MRKIVLKITSAKVVNTEISNKTLKTTIGKNGKTIESTNDMENIIHDNHLKNAIHVMLSMRPVSFKYGDRSKLSSRICNIVDSGIIRYDNVFKAEQTFKNGQKKTIFHNTFTQGQKASWNSTRDEDNLKTVSSNGEVFKGLYLTWDKLKKRQFYSPQYYDVENLLIEFGNSIGCSNIRKDYTLIDLLIKIRDGYPDYVQKFNKIKHIAPIYNILNGKKSDSTSSFNSLGSSNLSALGNNISVIPKVSVDATVILFVEDEDAEILLNSKRFATILDGGYIRISEEYLNVKDLPYIDNDEVEDEINEYLLDNFIRINTLPHTKKVEYEN